MTLFSLAIYLYIFFFGHQSAVSIGHIVESRLYKLGRLHHIPTQCARMSLKHWQSSPLPWPNKMLSSGQNSHRNILRTRTLPRFVISREPQKEWDAEMTYDDIAALTFDIKCHSRAVDFKQVLRAAWFGLFRAVLSIPANESSCSELRMGESCSRDFFSQHRRNKKSVITSTRETSDYHACP